MTSFWIKLISSILIAASFIVYNNVTNERKQSEKIADLEFQLENQSGNSNNADTITSDYKDGKYEGEADGFGGTIKVEVVIKSGEISQINILSAEHEDKAYLNTAETIIDDILNKQSSDVDTISGATFSSTGIKNAVKEALGKAE